MCLLGLITILSAQQLNFEAAVDRTTVGQNETFTLEVTARGEDIGSLPRPELPAMPDLDVLGQSQSQSTNISFINGKMSKQVAITFIYTLRPKKTGKAVIGPCRLEYKGQTYQTQPIDIEVVPGATRTQSRPGPGPRPGPQPASISAGDNLFIEATASRTSLYVGEQTNIEYTLYSAYDISDAGHKRLPSFGGFWSEPIYELKEIAGRNTVRNGRNYLAAPLKRTALFPISSGALRIDPLGLTVVVILPPRDFFDLFGTQQQVPLESNALTINVKPLPEPKPPDFGGGVGRFTITAAMDRDSSVGSEPIKLTVRVAGRGNIRLIDKPAMPSINGLRILEPETRDGVNVAGDAIEGWKEFTFPVIPQTDGEYLVPYLTMSFFDPRAARYETVRTGEQRFWAVKTSPSAAVSDASGLKILGTDIRYIKPDARSLAGAGLAGTSWLVIVYPLGLLGIIFSFWLRRHRLRVATDHSYARRLRSSRLVRKRLADAEKKIKRGEHQDFYCSLSQAIIGYTGDRFNIETQAMTKDQFQCALAQKGVPAETIEQLLEILGRCDIARFSPDLLTARDPGDLLRKAKETLGRL